MAENKSTPKSKIEIKTDTALKKITSKRWVVIGICVFVTIVIFSVMFSGTKKSRPTVATEKPKINIIPKDLKKQSWEVNAQQKIDIIKQTMEDQQDNIERLNSFVKEQDQALERKDSEIQRLSNRIARQEERLGGITSDYNQGPNNNHGAPIGSLPPVPMLFEDTIEEVEQPKIKVPSPPVTGGNSEENSQVAVAPPAIPTSGFELSRNQKNRTRKVVHVPGGEPIKVNATPSNRLDKRRTFVAPDIQEKKYANDTKAVQAEYVENQYAGYLPPHTSAKIVTLSGLEALASAHAMSHPEPIFVRINSNGLISSMGKSTSRYWTEGCTVAIMAYGDLSASRVKGRLTKLVCHDKKNRRVIDEDIKGVLLDADGGLGLKGDVVRRNGALLASTVLAEFVSSMGSAFAQPGLADFSSASSGESGFGGFDTKAALETSAFSGLGSGADKIAEYLLEEAKAIFPVIVVPNGRKGTIVLEEGIALKWNNMDGLYSKRIKPVNPGPSNQG